ncbi:MAG: 23S rRNA (pseudouridine(1915)-N(3))-methyltransferase RlmH [Erysipelotrichaceae bacterium]|nr:23S rRNA (pseudouridine(1915)-N(3))-methyltransferase RlmH [Erysipelotrichaceae bacterium]
MIKIICIGKIKENYLKEAILEYKKRITKYDKIEILELPDYDYDLKKTLETESNNILKNINLKDYNILLDINSNTYTSLELASKIDKIRSINHNITFIIGGSYGVDERVKNIVQERISFSSLTFPHQLFRVILLEQIYRSFKIINHEEYHK